MKGKTVLRANGSRLLLTMMAFVLAIGSAAGWSLLANPLAGQAQETTNNRKNKQSQEQNQQPDATEPSITFGSAAAGANDPAANPNATVTAIEPVISEPAPAQEQPAEPVQSEPAPQGNGGALLDTPYDQLAKTDSDGDQIPDAFDNCPSTYNLGQEDSNGDGVGDACAGNAAPAEESSGPPDVGGPDTDGDGVPDAVDNCWLMANPSQKDGDGDGIGNGCDEGSTPNYYNDGSDISAERVEVAPQLAAGDPVITGSTAGEPVADAPAATGEGTANAAPADESGNGDASDTDDRKQRKKDDDETAGASDQSGGNVATDEQPVDESGGAVDEGKQRDRKQAKNDAAASDNAGAGGDGNGDGQKDKNKKKKNSKNNTDDSGKSGDGLTPVQRGDRPRRNPNLTEDSGPIQPPPKNTRRLEQPIPGYVTVAKIDAGAIGQQKDDKNTKSKNRQSDEKTPAADKSNKQNTSDKKQSDTVANAKSSTDQRQRLQAEPPAPAAEAKTRDEQPAAKPASGRAPAPIEAGVVIPNPGATNAGANTPAPDPGDGPVVQPKAELKPGTYFGWQLGGTGDTGSPLAAPAGDRALSDERAPEPANKDKNQAKQKQNKPAKPADESDGDTGKKAKKQSADKQDPNAWGPDDNYRGGEATRRGSGNAIAGTRDDEMYLTQRASTDQDRKQSFIYAVPVPDDGIYRVRLYFAETYWGAPGGGKGRVGKRVFDVDAEGQPALQDFDIYKEAGAMTALVKTFDVQVTDGTLELEFRAVKDQAVISGIEVLERVDDINTADVNVTLENQAKADKKDKKSKKNETSDMAADGSDGN